MAAPIVVLTGVVLQDATGQWEPSFFDSWCTRSEVEKAALEMQCGKQMKSAKTAKMKSWNAWFHHQHVPQAIPAAAVPVQAQAAASSQLQAPAPAHAAVQVTAESAHAPAPA